MNRFVRIATFAATVGALTACQPTEVGEANAEAQMIGSATGGVLPQLCSAHQVSVINVDGDLHDIWSGRETPDSGKQVATQPSFKLRFDHAVDPIQLGRAIKLTGQVVQNSDGTLTDCRASASNGGSNGGIDNVPLSIGNPVATWTAGTIHGTTQRFLFDFQVFVTGNVSGSPHIAGAIAAGGNVNLSSFSANSDAKFPYAIVANGNVAATSGSVLGAVSYGGTVSLPGSVYVKGPQTHESAIDFASLTPQVLGLSDALASLPSNSPATIGADKSVNFVGLRPDVNVFTVDASALSVAPSLNIKVPAGAATLINVTGRSVSISNLGINLVGATANRLVWNAASALAVTIGSVSIQGSIMAPRAAVSFNNGSMTGQLVAGSLAGSGSFNTVVFAGWESFGGNGADVTITTLRPLQRACSYTLTVSGPISTDLSCLKVPFSIAFVVDADGTDLVTRDNTGVRWNANHDQVQSFTPRPGVNTLASEVLARYAVPLGIGIGDTFASATSWKAPKQSRTTELFAQSHLGVPVEGGGFLIDEEKNASGQAIARWVRGANITNLPSVVTPTITAATAQTNALTRMHAKAPYPWVGSTIWKAPKTTLLFARKLGVSVLAWRVDLSASGVAETSYVDIDAGSGSVLSVTRNAKSADCQVTKPTAVVQSTGTVTFPPLFGVSTFQDMRVTGPSSEARLFNTLGPITGLPAQLAYFPEMEVFTGPRVSTPTAWIDPTKFSPVCNQTDSWTDPSVLAQARALWMLEGAFAFTNNQAFEFNAGTWEGSSGDDNKNSTVYRLIASDDVSWSTCPDDDTYSSSCDDSLKVARGPYSSFFSDPRTDPYIFLKPSFPDPNTGKIIDVVQPIVIGHEFGHSIVQAARKTLTLPSLSNDGEQGALSEGFADIYGYMVDRDIKQAQFSWSDLDMVGRNAADPKSVGRPDTVGGTKYCAPNQSSTCDGHENSTIFSHWFYLLGEGGSGTNDLGCSYNVVPPGADENERLQQALSITFYAMTQGLGSLPDFSQMSDATIGQAFAQYGDPMRHAAAEAWLAVGVGKELAPDKVTPSDGATNVSVFPVTLKWTTTDAQTWEVQVASDRKFTSVVLTSDATVLSTKGSTRTLGLPAQLDPAINTYYWRVRAKSTKPWGDCLSIFSFTTDGGAIQLLEPKSPNAAGVYPANPGGDFTWNVQPGVTQYFFTVKAKSPKSCPALSDTASQTISAQSPLGDTTVFNSVAPFAGQFGVTFDNTSTFYATIAAISSDGKSLAPCLIVPFTISPLSPPTQLYPKNGDLVPLKAVPYYVFTPVNGAVAYRVDIGRILTPFALQDIYSATKKVSELGAVATTPAGQPYLKFPIPLDKSAGTTDDVYWMVWAIDANGYQIHNYGLHVFDTTYHIGPAFPKIISPINGATGLNKDSTVFTWSAENADSSRQYQVLWSDSAGGSSTAVYVKHTGPRGAVQQFKVPNLKTNHTYTIMVNLQPIDPAVPIFALYVPYGINLDSQPAVTFTTGAAKTLAAPTLMWDVVCEPMVPGLAQLLNSGGATEFLIGDVAGADSVEMEFHDATDPNNLLNGPVTATADVACSEVAIDSATVGLCGASTKVRQCLVVAGDIHPDPAWGPANEAAAVQRARTLWGGFSYQLFRFRYNNTSQNIKGAWSRFGEMVSCVDTSICTFNKGDDNVAPTTKAPDFATAIGAENTCDDSKFAQWLNNTPGVGCVTWH